jgi:hypothetical protein
MRCSVVSIKAETKVLDPLISLIHVICRPISREDGWYYSVACPISTVNGVIVPSFFMKVCISPEFTFNTSFGFDPTSVAVSVLVLVLVMLLMVSI